MTRFPKRTAAATLVFALGGTPGAVAQGHPGERASARDAVTERFLERAPQIGERMPDAPVYDATGKKRRLRSLLEGRYTVLVLGCLT